MGSSAITYRGNGFWVSDGLLRVWLAAMAGRVRQDCTGWRAKARAHWAAEANSDAVGCIQANLDEYASDERTRGELIQLCRDVLADLRQSERTAFSPQELRQMIGGTSFTHSLPVSEILAVGEVCVRLLEGDLPQLPQGYFPFLHKLRPPPKTEG